MILFKAIYYDGNSEKEFNSEFREEYSIANLDKNDTSASCFENIIKMAFSHVGNGDKKKIKDYWISTTSDYSIAIDKYLNNSKYSFNGIAVINLPNTEFSGYIYDDNLRKFGFIDKDFSQYKVLPLWNTNSDGIAVTLDLSSEYTISYLASYLWLKGSRSSLDGFRPFTYANSSKEILIMGEKIKFEFIPKDKVEMYRKKYASNKVNDYYSFLYLDFFCYAPDSELKKSIFANNYLSEKDEYNEYLIDNISHILGEEGSYIDLSEPFVMKEVIDNFGIDEKYIRRMFNEKKENEKIKSIMRFYENTQYKYEHKKASNRFYNYRKQYDKWKCEDKDIIDYFEFNIVYKNYKITFEKYLYAYVYASIYLLFKLDNKYRKKLNAWKILNKLYNYRFVGKDGIRKDQFMRNYKNYYPGILN